MRPSNEFYSASSAAAGALQVLRSVIGADGLSCMQAVMDHSHAMNGHAFGASREEYSRSPGGLSYNFGGSKPHKKGPMRPSMELRHRQLDLSLLQVGPCILFHDVYGRVSRSVAKVEILLCRASPGWDCQIACFRSWQ